MEMTVWIDWHEAKVLRVASADGIKFVIEDALSEYAYRQAETMEALP